MSHLAAAAAADGKRGSRESKTSCQRDLLSFPRSTLLVLRFRIAACRAPIPNLIAPGGESCKVLGPRVVHCSKLRRPGALFGGLAKRRRPTPATAATTYDDSGGRPQAPKKTQPSVSSPPPLPFSLVSTRNSGRASTTATAAAAAAAAAAVLRHRSSRCRSSSSSSPRGLRLGAL